MEELREKLKTDIDTADWAMLEPHQEKGAVLLLDEKLDLVDVGVAIALDKVDIVKLWLEGKLLQKPTDHMIEKYKNEKFKKQFQFLIIQPYVLIKHYEKESLS